MKKLLSVVLALCMIASLCTMAITTVSAETETAPVISKTTDFSVYFKEDGTVNDEEMLVSKTETTPVKNTYGKCTLSKSEAGNLVITPSVTTTFPSKDVSKGGGCNAYPVVTVWGETPDLKDAAYLAQGIEYRVTVRYKVNLVHADSTNGVQVGVGYYNCGTAGGTAMLNLSNRYIVARAKHTEATDDWQTLTTTVTSATFNTYLVVGVYGKNSQVEIDSVTWERDVATIAKAGSIRPEVAAEENNGVYQSAGIRFKGRVPAEFRDAATEIGFYAVPSDKLGESTIVEYIANEDNLAIKAKVKAEGMDEIIYAEGTDDYGRAYYDYQLIIVDLTREGYSVNLLATDITCVMYVVVGGESYYSEAFEYCYNDVLNAQ